MDMATRIFKKCKLNEVPALPSLYEILVPKPYKEKQRTQRKGFRRCNYCSTLVEKKTMFHGRSKNYYICIECAKAKSKQYQRNNAKLTG